MKNLFKIISASVFLSATAAFSQCTPINLPMVSPTEYGGSICLEGSAIAATPTLFYDKICLEDYQGDLYVNRYTTPANVLQRNLRLSYNTLSLLPANNYDHFDLSFDYIASSASKAIIRSKRGTSRANYLQFLTNNTSNTNPSVQMTIDPDGRVGLGTETPNYIFDVYGDAKFTNESIDDGKLVIKGANSVNSITNGNFIPAASITKKRDLSFEFVGAGSAKIRSFRGANSDTYLQFLTSTVSNATPEVRMQINEDGKIVIGNVTVPSAATYKLYVQGGILTEKVKVALSSSTLWADYVFAKDYKLKPLYEVEAYINKNNHLPNVPSSEDILKDGLDVAEMQAKQMEKIEEITLYLIELKKEVDSLKKENSELRTALSNKK